MDTDIAIAMLNWEGAMCMQEVHQFIMHIHISRIGLAAIRAYLRKHAGDYYSKCGRILSMDKQSALFLPPVHRPYEKFVVPKFASGLPKNQSLNTVQAYHVSCSPPDV
ncbi:Mediator of RNA polymerase II transcription subunit 27 [Bienertia sinuspersici]